MKKTFKRVAAWALALCMCVSCVSGALAAETLVVGDITVDALADEQSSGSYDVSYTAKLTMTESFAKAVTYAVEFGATELKALEFVCTLEDALVGQLTVAESDIVLNSDIFEYVDASFKQEDNKITIGYKLKESVVDGWIDDITTLGGEGKNAVVADLVVPMTMKAAQSKVATAEQVKAAGGNSISGTAIVTVKGAVPANFETFFTPEKDGENIVAAKGSYTVEIDEYRTGGGGSAITSYQVNIPAMSNGKITATPSWASAGAKITLTVAPDAGYTVKDLTVTDKDGKEVKLTKTGDSTYSFTMPKSRVNVSASFVGGIADPATTGVAAKLNADDHIAYMNGDNKGNFRPNANITRAEVAQVFYNLLTDKSTAKASFNDVAADAWYAEAVGTLAGMGIVNGVGSNNFQPNRSITRAEFATIAARFAKASAASFDFNDVPKSHWAYSYISTAAAYGWVTGSGNNKFEPERAITRAEVATIVNRMLRRLGDEAAIDAGEGRDWPDVSDSHWAAVAIAEATNGHDHDYNETYTQESWIAE